MACDMPEPCKFPSYDSCQQRFLCTHKEVDLAPNPIVGVVLKVGDVEVCHGPLLLLICRGLQKQLWATTTVNIQCLHRKS